jgi:L-fucose isomerase-like protein
MFGDKNFLDRPCVTLIPVGSASATDVKRDLEKAKEVLKKLDLELTCLDPVSDSEQALHVAKQVRNLDVDLLAILALHGLTADVQVAIAGQLEIPTVVWILPERHSLSTSASALGALRDLGHHPIVAYGRADDERIGERIRLVSRCAFALNRMRRARIGEIGGLYPVLVASKYHEDTLAQKLGPKVVHISINEVRSFLEGIKERGLEEAIATVSRTFRVNGDRETFRKAVKFHLALRAIAGKYRLSGIALNCYGELIREFESAPCLGFVDESYVVGCEGDVVALSMLLLSKYLTERDGFLADLYTINSDGTLVLVNCAGAASLSASGEDTTIGIGGSTVDMPVPLAFCRPVIPHMKVTLGRIFGRELDKMHIASGEVVSCTTQETVLLSIRLNQDMQGFLDRICNAHYIVFPGDVSQQLALFCSWNGITIV